MRALRSLEGVGLRHVLSAQLAIDVTCMIVRFCADRAQVLGALASGRMPEEVTAGEFAFEVAPQLG